MGPGDPMVYGYLKPVLRLVSNVDQSPDGLSAETRKKLA